MIAGVISGMIRTTLMDPDGRVTVVPVDYVVNSVIAAAFKSAAKSGKSYIEFLNCSFESKITNRQAQSHLIKACPEKAPYRKLFWVQSGYMTSNFVNFSIRFLLFQLIPALFIDVVVFMTGNNIL